MGTKTGIGLLVLVLATAGAFITLIPAEPEALTVAETITVFKSPACGCCTQWVKHLRDNGFKVKTEDVNDVNSIKIAEGIPARLASCHTAFIGDYIIEGHVPAADIQRLLQERPDIVGLTVPGMPMGSPGMEGPRQDRYTVLTFTETGDTEAFSQY